MLRSRAQSSPTSCRRAPAGRLLDAPYAPAYSPPASKLLRDRKPVLNFLKSIFTWWNGATIGARFHIGRRGVFVGQDDRGNRYFEAKDNSDSYDQRKRRWVIYQGYADASKVSPDWHGWLHYTFDAPPTLEPFRIKSWEKDHLPN